MADAAMSEQEVLYRHYGPDGDRCVSLCPHLRAELDDQLASAIEAGAMLEVTKAEVERCNLTTFIPVDLTEEERFAFAELFTRYFFWVRGGCKCEVCGHIARGALAQSSREEKKRWREADLKLEHQIDRGGKPMP